MSIIFNKRHEFKTAQASETKFNFRWSAVSSIAASSTIGSQFQQTPRNWVLQPESAIAQTRTRESQDAIVRWNAITLDIIKAEKTSAPLAAHNLAMVHVAVYDAANAIVRLALMAYTIIIPES